MTGRTRILAKMTVLLVMLVCMSPVVMADVPPGPNVFEGTVLINDLDAPVGTVIEAYIDHGDMIPDGSTTVSVAGEYSITVSSGSSTDVNKNVIFKVLNINSTDVGTFKNGPIIQDLDLTVEDLTAPVTTDDAPSAWQNSSFTITLTASDVSGSGVNSTFYKVNDGSWTSGSSILIDTEGNNTILYYSVDNVGNVESDNTIYAKLDLTDPVTTDDVPVGWQNSSFTITLTASDVSGSGVNSTFYKVNDGSWTSGTSVLIDVDGNNTVMYYSVDNVGNVESSNTVYAKLDTTDPDTTDDAPSGWQNSSFTITLAASDVSGSGANTTFYKVNDGSWTSGSSVLIDTEGNNTVLYYSVDNVGNVESTNTVYAKLDLTSPVTSDDAPSGWQNSSFTITLTANDVSGSGVNSTYYKVDDGSWTSGTSVLIDSEGNHSVLYFSVDNAGNIESVNNVYAKMDVTDPVTSDDTPSAWQNSSFTITLTASDVSGSGVNSTFYKVNDGSWTSGSSVLIDTEGNNTVLYYSVDNVGNVESTNTVYAKLDLTDPVTADDVPSGWQNSSFTITLTANDVSGSGVNSTYYKVDDGSWTSGTSVLIDTEGNHSVMYYSVDNAGNVESDNTVYAKLDLTAPVVFIDPVTVYTNVSSQSINGSIVEGNLDSVTVNGISASLDGNNYSATIDLAEGDNTVTVVATDEAGNNGTNSTSIVLTLGPDPVPPILSNLTIVPEKILNTTTDRAIVTVNVTDEISGVNNVTINLSEINGSTQEMTSVGNNLYSYYISTEMVGEFSFNITAVDNVDNAVTSSQFYLNVTTSDEVISTYSGGDGMSPSEIEQAIDDNEAGLVSDDIVLALIEEYFR